MDDQLKEIIKQFIRTGALNKDHCEYSQEEIIKGVKKAGFTKGAIIAAIGKLEDNVLIRMKDRGEERKTPYYTLSEIIETYRKSLKKEVVLNKL